MKNCKNCEAVERIMNSEQKFQIAIECLNKVLKICNESLTMTIHMQSCNTFYQIKNQIEKSLHEIWFYDTCEATKDIICEEKSNEKETQQ